MRKKKPSLMEAVYKAIYLHLVTEMMDEVRKVQKQKPKTGLADAVRIASRRMKSRMARRNKKLAQWPKRPAKGTTLPPE